MSEVRTADVLLFSDNATTRQQVMNAVGRRPGPGLPQLRWDETATAAMVIDKVEAHQYELLILDAEATKEGGMAVAKQLKQEIFNCPPILLLIARPQDSWLAHWSEADDVLHMPLQPRRVQEKIAGLLKGVAA
ncbi:MAG: hypothetical protein Q4Q03_05905 [Bowdeniella nasicola]|nr:hypothetical protein [Bowdeniella nasicola]